MRVRVAPRWWMWSLAALVLAADQASKAWVVAHLIPNVPTDVFPWLRPIASFTYVTNRGVAFGLLPQFGDVFTIFGVLIIAAILVFQRSLQDESAWVYAALGLQIGGAMGNVLDRLFRGQVVDFIDLNFWPMQSWPISNVADVCIVLGVMVLLVSSALWERRSEAAKGQPAAASAVASSLEETQPLAAEDAAPQGLEHENVEA